MNVETETSCGAETVAQEQTGAAPVALAQCDWTRTLIVDDEERIVRLFKIIISSAFPTLTVDQAFNGAEALEAFKANHHAVLIMDIHMPVMDGQSSFVEIRKLCQERAWEMPSVVFCTGYAPPGAVKSLVMQDSNHALLLKPIRGEAIVEAVRKRLGRRQSPPTA